MSTTSNKVATGTNSDGDTDNIIGSNRPTKVFSFLAVIVVLASIYYYLYNLEEDQNNTIMGKDDESWKNAKSVYEFKFNDIDGVEQSMEKYKDNVLIITNVASECGLTKANYEQLGELYDKYQSKGLRILGFPCNQFAGQEPLDEAQIKTTTCSKFKVTFELTQKINVNGDNAHPLWKYLKQQQGGTLGSFIKWNFTKFLIDKQGQVVKRYGPNTDPVNMDKDVVEYLAK